MILDDLDLSEWSDKDVQCALDFIYGNMGTYLQGIDKMAQEGVHRPTMVHNVFDLSVPSEMTRDYIKRMLDRNVNIKNVE